MSMSMIYTFEGKKGLCHDVVGFVQRVKSLIDTDNPPMTLFLNETDLGCLPIEQQEAIKNETGIQTVVADPKLNRDQFRFRM